LWRSSEPMPIGPKRMPFFSHLAELRHRILVIAVTIGVGSVVAYPFTGSILEWLFAPIAPYLPKDATGNVAQVFVTGPFEAFLLRFKIASYAAIVLTSPIWLWQLLAFFLPALKEKERKFFVPTFVAILVLFLAGNLFCHYVVLPPSFQWLMAQTTGGSVDLRTLLYNWFHIGSPAGPATVALSVLPVATSFLGGVMIMMLAFGFTFELPVLLFFLIGIGVVKYQTLRKNWRYVYLGLIAFASLATPDWSPITIGALFGAVVVLYECTMVFSRFAFANRIREQALEAAEAA
jgi:sec-independent protein translocase protein TatC